MISLFVIQATTRCNLNCKYCYLPADSRRAFQRMPLATLHKAAELVFTSSLMPHSLTVLWHAGEPLAAGIGFFRDALDIIDNANIHAKEIGHSIQTNGTMINQSWCRMFKDKEFEVGVSMDGPEFLHNLNRVGWHNKGSFSAAMNGVHLLHRNELRYGAICVLTKKSLSYPDEIFDFFVDNGFRSIAFNVEEIEAANSKSSLLEADGLEETRARYVAFLKRLMERWVCTNGKIHIREFNSMAHKILLNKSRPRYVPMLDVSQGLQIVTVRTDGSIVAFSPELASGTATDPDAFVVGHVDQLTDLEGTFSDRRYIRIRNQIKAGIAKCKSECGYFSLCGGGWPSNKFAENGTFECSETMNCYLHTKTLADVVIETFTSTDAFKEAAGPYINISQNSASANNPATELTGR